MQTHRGGLAAFGEAHPLFLLRAKVPNRLATEVEERHELLCWYVGDWLCGDCIHNGAWA